MRSAYSWQLRGFLAAIGILLVVQMVILAAGVGAVLRGYSRLELNRLEDQARRILLGAGELTGEEYQHSGPFFVFSANRQLVYSNRGRGRSVAENEYRPVTYNSSVIGYFYAEEVRFLSTVANRFFFTAVAILLVGSMGISFAIAVLAASRSARTIAGAVEGIRTDIGALRAHERVEPRGLPVRELSDISEDLHEVSGILADSEDYKRRWMQDISHDLRSPISGLKSQLEGMRDGVLEPGEDRFQRTLLDVERLEEMVSSIAELHSIESIPELETEVIPIGGLLEDLEAAHETALRAAGASMTTSASVANIRAHRGLLLRALGNIVRNGIEYGGSGVHIHVFVEHDGQDVILSVTNDGPSIPPDQLTRIFQRFFRGEFARNTPGSGLGLNIASEIAVRHGGSLHAENKEPKGVRFTLSIPQHPPRE